MIFIYLACMLVIFSINCGAVLRNKNLPKYNKLTPASSFCYDELFKSEDCVSNHTDCYKWCKDKLNWTIVNSTAGAVRFQLPLAPKICCFNYYEIVMTVSENECNFTGNVSEHSSHWMKGLPSNECEDKDENKHLELVINHLFTGCYRMDVKPVNKLTRNLDYCIVKPIQLETDYKPIPFALSNVTNLYDDQRKEVNIVLSGDGCVGIGEVLEMFPCCFWWWVLLFKKVYYTFWQVVFTVSISCEITITVYNKSNVSINA